MKTRASARKEVAPFATARKKVAPFALPHNHFGSVSRTKTRQTQGPTGTLRRYHICNIVNMVLARLTSLTRPLACACLSVAAR